MRAGSFLRNLRYRAASGPVAEASAAGRSLTADAGPECCTQRYFTNLCHICQAPVNGVSGQTQERALAFSKGRMRCSRLRREARYRPKQKHGRRHLIRHPPRGRSADATFPSQGKAFPPDDGGLAARGLGQGTVLCPTIMDSVVPGQVGRGTVPCPIPYSGMNFLRNKSSPPRKILSWGGTFFSELNLGNYSHSMACFWLVRYGVGFVILDIPYLSRLFGLSHVFPLFWSKFGQDQVPLSSNQIYHAGSCSRFSRIRFGCGQVQMIAPMPRCFSITLSKTVNAPASSAVTLGLCLISTG